MRRRVIFLIMPLIAASCSDTIHDLVNREDAAQIKRLLQKDPALVNDRTDAGKTPLHYAVTYAKPEFIDLFVANGADINAPDNTGLTPLHAAAMLGREEEAARLLSHGAKIEARDLFGDTPFHIAALFGQCGMMRLLANAGADVNAANDDAVTPLDAAMKSRRKEAVEMLEKIEEEND